MKERRTDIGTAAKIAFDETLQSYPPIPEVEIEWVEQEPLSALIRTMNKSKRVVSGKCELSWSAAHVSPKRMGVQYIVPISYDHSGGQ